MPPKSSSAKKTDTRQAQGPTKQELKDINDYLAQKPDFPKLIEEAKANPQPPARQVEADFDRILRESVKEIIEEKAKAAGEKSREVIMPVLPKDGDGGKDLKEQLGDKAKESTSSTQTKASFEHHTAHPGPVMADNLGPKATKEELRKRAEELNKKD